MNQKQLEERRAWKAAFRARLTLFAEQRQIPKSEMAWLGRIKHEAVADFAERYSVRLAWLLKGEGQASH
jgi:hypothetical protein